MAVNIVYLVGAPRSASARSAGTTARRRRPSSRTSAHSCVRRWRRAPGACPRGSTIRRELRRHDELVALSEEASRLGGIYHTHVRYSLGDRFLDPFREAIDIGRRARGPRAHHALLPADDGARRAACWRWSRMRAPRLDVTFDGYPYAGSTRLNIVIPQWAFDGGLAALRRNLADPGRVRMKKEMGPRAASWHDMWVTHLKRPGAPRFEGRSLAEVAELMGLEVVDAICELLLREDQQVSYVSAGANMATMPRFVSHPLYMVGSDAVLIGDYPSPRTYGTFPSDSRRVRPGRALARPDGGHPQDDGLPRPAPGSPRSRAPSATGSRRTSSSSTPTVKAPATRREPKQFPVGIEQVIVNGRSSWTRAARCSPAARSAAAAPRPEPPGRVP